MFGSQLIDVVDGADTAPMCARFADRDPAWVRSIAPVTMDMSATYLKVVDTMVLQAKQVVDRFHLIRLANQRFDECRRRIQNQTLGRRGRKHDPLYRIRRRLTIAVEHLSPDSVGRVDELLDASHPSGHLRQLWWAKEQLRSVFDHPDPGVGAAPLLLFAKSVDHSPLPARTTRTRPHHLAMAPPDPQLVLTPPDQQRTHRVGQQPHETRQTSSIWVPPL